MEAADQHTPTETEFDTFDPIGLPAARIAENACGVRGCRLAATLRSAAAEADAPLRALASSFPPPAVIDECALKALDSANHIGQTSTMPKRTLGRLDKNDLPRNYVLAWRRALSMTQDTLAEKAGIDRTHLSKIERGVVGYSPRVLEGIATALGITSREIMEPPGPGSSKRRDDKTPGRPPDIAPVTKRVDEPGKRLLNVMAAAFAAIDPQLAKGDINAALAAIVIEIAASLDDEQDDRLAIARRIANLLLKRLSGGR